jgi:F-type H+-transporting ATPase subunit b
MQFDLFTFIAQIVNFLVLVLLLRIFLYKRVIQAMDRREAKIASRLNEAQAKREEAERQAVSYQELKRELEEQRDELLRTAREEAGQHRKELMQEARKEVEENRSRWHQSLQQQKDRFLSVLRQRAGEESFRIARKALQDLAEEDLEQRIGLTFLKRIRDLDGEQRRELVDKLGDSGAARLLSAFVLPEPLREQIEEELKNLAGSAINLKYETSPQLIAGVELKVEDKKIAFSLEQYLQDLEARLDRILARETGEDHAHA